MFSGKRTQKVQPKHVLNQSTIKAVRTALIFMLMAATATFAADTSRRMELPKSGSVILTSSEDKNVTRYFLSLKTSAETEIRLASHEVPRSDSPPSEGRALWSCDENAEAVVVLLDVNDFAMILIQYDLDWKAVKEYRIFAPNILSEMRMSGGDLRVIAPNKITLSAPDREPLSWSVVDDKLIGEENKPRTIALLDQVSVKKSSRVLTSSFTARGIILASILAALGLRRFLLKRRSVCTTLT